MEADEVERFDPQAAMDLLTDTHRRAGRALDVNGAVLYDAWGMAWLIGYLAIWLSVHGHAVYQPPAAWAFIILGASAWSPPWWPPASPSDAQCTA